MIDRQMLMEGLLLGAFSISSCQSTPKPVLLAAPAGTSVTAAGHNNEGIHAYEQGQWDSAKHHFEAAIAASPELAEAHYNLGKVLYRLGALREGDAHFIKAANLAPGNKVIWNAPPLSNVAVPEKEVTMPGGDGHMHSHYGRSDYFTFPLETLLLGWSPERIRWASAAPRACSWGAPTVRWPAARLQTHVA